MTMFRLKIACWPESSGKIVSKKISLPGACFHENTVQKLLLTWETRAIEDFSGRCHEVCDKTQKRFPKNASDKSRKKSAKDQMNHFLCFTDRIAVLHYFVSMSTNSRKKYHLPSEKETDFLNFFANSSILGQEKTLAVERFQHGQIQS